VRRVLSFHAATLASVATAPAAASTHQSTSSPMIPAVATAVVIAGQ
jgi:hypothetical protein